MDLQTAPHLDQLSATVCVIGSGPAGGVVAIQLASAGIDVVLLEAGASTFDNRRLDTIGPIDISAQCGHTLRYYEQLGGSSNRWGGRLAPFDDVDLEHRDWVPFSGWPIGMEELRPYYERSSALLGISNDARSTSYPPGGSLILSDEIEVRCYRWARSRYDTRAPLSTMASSASSTLKVVVNAPVQRLATNADRTRVEHVEVASLANKNIKVTADIFVLAAGAIQTPRLLLNSASDHSCGLGDELGNVGRYFTTHPRADIGSVTLNESVETNHPLFQMEYLQEEQRRFCIAFSRSAQATHGMLNHHVQLLPYLEQQVVQLFEKVKRNKVTQTMMFDRRSRLRGLLPGLALSTYRMMERATVVQRRGRVFKLRGFLDQYPNPENRIYLSNAIDSKGARQAAITWRFSETDRQSVLAFLDRLNSSFAKRRLGHVDYQALAQSDDWPMTGIHSHFMGTTRMGDSPKTAVTDKDGRLFQTLNLYVAGPSLFPTSGSANPFFTIVALSLRLADHIEQTLKTKSKVDGQCRIQGSSSGS